MTIALTSADLERLEIEKQKRDQFEQGRLVHRQLEARIKELEKEKVERQRDLDRSRSSDKFLATEKRACEIKLEAVADDRHKFAKQLAELRANIDTKVAEGIKTAMAANDEEITKVRRDLQVHINYSARLREQLNKTARTKTTMAANDEETAKARQDLEAQVTLNAQLREQLNKAGCKLQDAKSVSDRQEQERARNHKTSMELYITSKMELESKTREFDELKAAHNKCSKHADHITSKRELESKTREFDELKAAHDKCSKHTDYITSQYHQEIENIRQQYSGAAQDKTATDESLAAARSDADNLRQELQRVQQEAQNTQAQTAQQMKHAQEQHDKMIAEIKSAEAKFAKQAAQIQALENELQTAQTNSVQTTVDHQAAHIQALKEELQSTRNSAQAALNDQATEIKSLKERLQSTQNLAQTTVDEKAAEIQTLQNQLKTAQTNSDKAMVERQAAEIKALKEQLETARDDANMEKAMAMDEDDPKPTQNAPQPSAPASTSAPAPKFTGSPFFVQDPSSSITPFNFAVSTNLSTSPFTPAQKPSSGAMPSAPSASNPTPNFGAPSARPLGDIMNEMTLQKSRTPMQNSSKPSLFNASSAPLPGLGASAPTSSPHIPFAGSKQLAGSVNFIGFNTPLPGTSGVQDQQAQPQTPSSQPAAPSTPTTLSSVEASKLKLASLNKEEQLLKDNTQLREQTEALARQIESLEAGSKEKNKLIQRYNNELTAATKKMEESFLQRESGRKMAKPVARLTTETGFDPKVSMLEGQLAATTTQTKRLREENQQLKEDLEKEKKERKEKVGELRGEVKKIAKYANEMGVRVQYEGDVDAEGDDDDEVEY